MSAPTTAEELHASLALWLNRDDLTNQIPEFIGLAEARFNRTLMVPEREATVTASVSTETFELPDDFWGIRSIYLDGSHRYALRQMSLSELRDHFQTSGTPEAYAIQSGNKLVLGPEPSAAVSLILNYYQTIPALESGPSTNWLLTAHPDLYIAGALVEAYLYLRDTDGALAWEARLQGKTDEIRKSSIAKHNSGSPLVRRGFAAQVRHIFS